MVESNDIDTTPLDAASYESAITAYIDALPNELLARIFSIGAASKPLIQHNEPSLFALLVSHISRRWREVAMAYPPFWSHLFFTTNPRSDRWITDVFLPRSGTHPLDVTVCRLDDELDDETTSMHQAMKTILPHCARWRTLCVRPRDNADFALIMGYIRDISVPLLQQVEILCPHYDEVEWRAHTSHIPSFILGAPALTSVRLRAPCIMCGPWPSLANLTSFEFNSELSDDRLTQSELESIVAASPALRVLRLRLRHFTPEMFGRRTITIPSLRDLSFHCRDHDHQGASMRLFACMHIPTLESLEFISLKDDDMNYLWRYCQKFPNYPRPQTLKLFSVLNARTPWSSYDRLFELFPTITSLYINRSSASVIPVLSRLPILSSLTYNCMPLRNSSSGSPVQLKYIDCVQWILRHVQDCHGTPDAMQSVRIGYSARQNRREEDYQRLRGLVDLVELADEDDFLQESWSSDDETVNEEQYVGWGDDDDEEEDGDDEDKRSDA